MIEALRQFLNTRKTTSNLTIQRLQLPSGTQTKQKRKIEYQQSIIEPQLNLDFQCEIDSLSTKITRECLIDTGSVLPLAIDLKTYQRLGKPPVIDEDYEIALLRYCTYLQKHGLSQKLRIKVTSLFQASIRKIRIIGLVLSFKTTSIFISARCQSS